MKPVKLTQAALGNSAWAPLNQVQAEFGVSIGCAVTSGASLTYKIQHTFDDPGPDGRRAISVSRAATVATVIDNDHRLSVGDSLVITGTGSTVMDGTFDVATVVDANTYTYTVVNSGPTVDQTNTFLNSFRVYTHATIVGQTGRVDGNYAFPVQAVRLVVTVFVSGKVDAIFLQGMGR